MAEVHWSKVVSSLEPRPLRPNVVTNFEWDVQSLREKRAQTVAVDSPYISSPGFDVHGTEHLGLFNTTQLATTNVNLRWRHCGTLQLALGSLKNYRVAVEATLRCGDHEETRALGQTSGKIYDEPILFLVPPNCSLGREIEKRNCFSVRVQLTTVSAIGEHVDTPLKVKQTMLKQPLSLASDFKCALASGELSDVTLKSEEGKEFPAHRQLLALRSPVFRAMFYGQMKEATSGIANIKASSAGVQQLLQCIYTDEVDTKVVGIIGLELYELGIQYNLTRIVDVARTELFSTLSIDNAIERLLFALRHSIADLVEASEAIIKGNLAAVMLTDGWKQIMTNPSVMSRLINGGNRHRDDDGLSPAKRKRQRSSM